MSAEGTGGERGRVIVWNVYSDNNKKESYNAYEVTSTDWEGDPTNVFSVHNNSGTIDTNNSVKELNDAGIKFVSLSKLAKN